MSVPRPIWTLDTDLELNVAQQAKGTTLGMRLCKYELGLGLLECARIAKLPSDHFSTEEVGRKKRGWPIRAFNGSQSHR